jgi:predicted MPP superfamily phosphohydrolase
VDDRARSARLKLLLLVVAVAVMGCAKMGRLTFVDPVAPVLPENIATARDSAREERGERAETGGPSGTGQSIRPIGPLRAMFADTLLGFRPNTADSAKRYLGRLRRGFVADTLEFILMGDNRPAFRTTRLRKELTAMRGMFSLNPLKFLKGLVSIPLFLVKGTIPDFAIARDVPALLLNKPTYGREHQVVEAVMRRADSLEAAGRQLSLVINTGDLVKDGRRPSHWTRFMRITRPLYERIPYFAIAGNHERTDDSLGIANWRTALGLPITGNLLHYCFDSADGWVRFIAIDSNPMTDEAKLWSREDAVAATNEQFAWMIARLKEHNGPAFVMMHHPPFSAGFHRMQWQADSVLYNRRETMVKALQESGLAVLAASHEHNYQRALLTTGDAVLVCIVSGGAGSPLHQIATGDEAARIFSLYQLPQGVFKPENVVSAVVFHYVHMRLWYGGGEFYTYAVDGSGVDKMIDHVEIDLKRFGTPKIDQDKMPIPQTTGPQVPDESANPPAPTAAPDTTKGVKPVVKPAAKKTTVRPKQKAAVPTKAPAKAPATPTPPPTRPDSVKTP